jgi:hypothetical protein
MPRRSLRRLLLTVFVILVVELLPLRWIPSGWLGLVSGVFGSIFLLFPPLRLELFKAARGAISKPQPKAGPERSPRLEEWRRNLDEYFKGKIDNVDELDAIWLLIGGILLMFYFIYQIPGKLELANMENMVQTELEQFKEREVSPLQDRIRDVEDQLQEVGKISKRY